MSRFFGWWSREYRQKLKNGSAVFAYDISRLVSVHRRRKKTGWTQLSPDLQGKHLSPKPSFYFICFDAVKACFTDFAVA